MAEFVTFWAKAERIRSALEQRTTPPLTKSELCRRVGITNTMWTKYRTEGSVPTHQRLKVFAEVLKCNVVDLEPEDGAPNLVTITLTRDECVDVMAALGLRASVSDSHADDQEEHGHKLVAETLRKISTRHRHLITKFDTARVVAWEANRG